VKTKQICILLIVFFWLGVYTFPVFAQTSPALAILEVDLRPEFDQPGVLVVFHMVLKSDTQLPATLTVRIPTAAGEPSLVAWVNPSDGSMNSIPYQVDTKKDWNWVTFTTSANEVDFEYHDPSLALDGSKRAYQFTWPGDFSADNLSIYIQEPLGATGMLIQPSLGSPNQGDNNIVYYYSKLGALKQGTTFQIHMKYDKKDSSLSWETLQVKPSATLDENTSGRTSLRELMPWIIGGISILLLAGVAWWIWLIRNSPASTVKLKVLQASLNKVKKSTREPVYCPQCGKRAETGDVFCRVCGAKLRR
jgi:hypothetical protein